MSADHVDHVGRAGHGHAELGADGLAAVGGDDVPGPDGEFLAGVVVAHGSGDLVVCLFPAGDFVVVADLAGGPLFRVAAQQRFQPQLGVVAGFAGAIGVVAFAQAPAAEGVHFKDRAPVKRPVAAERGEPPDLAELLQRAANLVDRIGHVVLAEDLHGPLVEVVRFRQVGCRGMPLHEQMLHSQVGEEDGGGQAAAAAADDQHGYVDDRHGERSLVSERC